MIRRSQGGKPLEVIGSDDPLEKSRALLEAQQGYKAPISKKDMAIQALFGFLRGGIPGAIVNTAQYGLDPNYRTDVAMGRGIANTENQINRELIVRGKTNDLLNDQSLREYRGAQTDILTREPEREAAKLAEQERDNVRQVYNSLPFFDAINNPQHKAIADRAAKLGIMLPNRDEKDNWVLEKVNGELKRVSKATGKVVDTGLVNRADVPVEEDGLTVTPGQALLARSNRENREYQRGEKRSESESKKAAKEREAAELIANAEIYENNANEAEAEARRFSDPNNYNELAAQAADARARENRTQANILRRQATAARAEANAIPATVQPISRPQRKISEAEIREAARLKGLDPDVAVARAKTKGLL